MRRPERIAYLYDHKMAFLAMTFLGGNSIQQQFYGLLENTILPEEPEVRYEADRVVDGRSGLTGY